MNEVESVTGCDGVGTVWVRVYVCVCVCFHPHVHSLEQSTHNQGLHPLQQQVHTRHQKPTPVCGHLPSKQLHVARAKGRHNAHVLAARKQSGRDGGGGGEGRGRAEGRRGHS